jgi:hypothetical protein
VQVKRRHKLGRAYDLNLCLVTLTQPPLLPIIGGVVCQNRGELDVNRVLDEQALVINLPNISQTVHAVSKAHHTRSK